jgi:hypothetical protein
MLFLIISRSLAYFNKGLEKLCKTDEGYQATGRIKYELIDLFDVIMNRIEDFSIREYDAENTDLQQHNAEQSSQSKAGQENVPILDIQAALCRVLVGMTKEIKVDLPARKDILEGYFHIFLNHLGHTIDAVVFRTSPKALGRSYYSIESDFSKRQNQISLALPHLAPYIVWLLRQVLPELHSFGTNSRMNSTSASSPTTGSHSQVKRNLCQQVNRKIQTTLLQAIFADDKDNFLDTLHPRSNEPDCSITRPLDLVFSKESTDIFPLYLDELWHLIGWETLGLQDDGASDLSGV